VAAWVQDLVAGLPGVSFSVAHLREEEDATRPVAYERPANLHELRTLDVDPDRADPDGFLIDRMPDARVYHSLSTGLAGLVGAETAREREGVYLLTEHGLAWREARLGISGCKPHISGCKPHRTAGRMDKEQWAAFVEASARHAYERAAATTTVCASNVRLQRTQGADPRRLRVIPNSVAQPDMSEDRTTPFPTVRGQTPEFPGHKESVWTHPRIGFVGRVVAIKDIETFLRACRLVADELPAAEFAVVGPLDHEPDYAEACIDLAASLGLQDRIVFAGETDVEPWYERLDAVVLTSLSEAQPLVLLEAMAAGVSVVATAVGGCPDLVGGAGLLTPVRDPRAPSSSAPRGRTPSSREGSARGATPCARVSTTSSSRSSR